jgi:hypothetical protein
MSGDDNSSFPAGSPEEEEALEKIPQARRGRGRPRRLWGSTGLFEHLGLGWCVTALIERDGYSMIERDGYSIDRAFRRVAEVRHRTYENVRKHWYGEGRVAPQKDSKLLRYAVERAKAGEGPWAPIEPE